MDDDHELSERVDRLLRPQPAPERSAKVLVPLLAGASGVIAASVAVVLLWPGSLTMVHQALEQLMR